MSVEENITSIKGFKFNTNNHNSVLLDANHGLNKTTFSEQQGK